MSLSAGVAGLPAGSDSLSPRALYAVTMSHGPLLQSHAARGAAAALRAGQPVAVVCGFPAAALWSALKRLGVDGDRECRRGSLQVFEPTGDWAALLDRYGAERVVDELDQLGVSNGSHLVLAPADAAFNWRNAKAAIRQAGAYHDWCADRDLTGLFLFGPAVPPVAAQVSLRMLSESFAGIAHLRGDGAQFHWDIEHWRGSEATVIDQSYPVGFDGQGAPFVLRDSASESKTARRAPDEDDVFSTQEAVAGDPDVPESWRLLPDRADWLDTVGDAVAATCLLDHGPSRNLRELARTVYDTRLRFGNALKIVVRIRGQRLRYNDELLLLRLGANTVIPSDASLVDVRARIGTLQGKLYSRELADDFDQAVLAAAPPPAGGYQPPASFSAVSKDAMTRAETLSMENALVRLHIMPNVPHLDALSACRLKRPGDLFTADDNSVYLFLFACRETDIDATVDRVFSAPLAELFEGQTRFANSDNIRSALDELAARLDITPMADFSSQLSSGQATPAAKAAPAAAVRSAEPAPPTRPGYVPAGLPRTVVRLPLPLRSALA